MGRCHWRGLVQRVLKTSATADAQEWEGSTRIEQKRTRRVRPEGEPGGFVRLLETLGIYSDAPHHLYIL